MYSYISGKIVEVTQSTVVVDCGGVGYLLYGTADCLARCHVGEFATVPVWLVVREDALTLFGFGSTAEKQAFVSLTSISGVGPKIALAILSGIRIQDLASAIASQDTAMLARIKGVGKKTAERIILELRDKVDPIQPTTPIPAGPASEAISALSALGFARSECVRLLADIDTSDLTVEQIVWQALKRR